MVNKNKPELLCPVGGKEQLIAAVENGADAVYFGGANFNARIYADNFDSIESIKEAVDYIKENYNKDLNLDYRLYRDKSRRRESVRSCFRNPDHIRL